MQRKREPTSPGEILLEEFLKPLGLTQRRPSDGAGERRPIDRGIDLA